MQLATAVGPAALTEQVVVVHALPALADDGVQVADAVGPVTAVLHTVLV